MRERRKLGSTEAGGMWDNIWSEKTLLCAADFQVKVRIDEHNLVVNLISIYQRLPVPSTMQRLYRSQP